MVQVPIIQQNNGSQQLVPFLRANRLQVLQRFGVIEKFLEEIARGFRVLFFLEWFQAGFLVFSLTIRHKIPLSII